MDRTRLGDRPGGVRKAISAGCPIRQKKLLLR
jgi:hypothetical protein